jgi:uncharacterized protein (DUF305 family)
MRRDIWAALKTTACVIALAIFGISLAVSATRGDPQNGNLAIPENQALQKGATNKSTDSPDWTELKSSMEKMHVAMMSMETSGNSDVDFVRLMIPHHQAAIDMARTQLLYGKDPQMRRLAQEIITAQQSEIELMKLWLKRHDSSSLNVNGQNHVGRKEH